MRGRADAEKSGCKETVFARDPGMAMGGRARVLGIGRMATLHRERAVHMMRGTGIGHVRQPMGREAIRTDLQGEGVLRRGHEAQGNQRTKREGEDHQRGHCPACASIEGSPHRLDVNADGGPPTSGSVAYQWRFAEPPIALYFFR
jgi:hypothetical protein